MRLAALTDYSVPLGDAVSETPSPKIKGLSGMETLFSLQAGLFVYIPGCTAYAPSPSMARPPDVDQGVRRRGKEEEVTCFRRRGCVWMVMRKLTFFASLRLRDQDDRRPPGPRCPAWLRAYRPRASYRYRALGNPRQDGGRRRVRHAAAGRFAQGYGFTSQANEDAVLGRLIDGVGTLDNPVLVRSAGDEQFAGCTGVPADSHNVIWLGVRRLPVDSV